MATINKYNLALKQSGNVVPLLGVLGENDESYWDTDFTRKKEYFKTIWNVSDIKWLASKNNKGMPTSPFVLNSYDIIGYPMVPYDEVASKITFPVAALRKDNKTWVNLGSHSFDNAFYVNKLIVSIQVVNEVTWQKHANNGYCDTSIVAIGSSNKPTTADFNIRLVLPETASLDGKEYGQVVNTKIASGTTISSSRNVISFHINMLNVDTGANSCVLTSASFFSNSGFDVQSDGKYLGSSSASWTSSSTVETLVDTADVSVKRYRTIYAIDPMTLA